MSGDSRLFVTSLPRQSAAFAGPAQHRRVTVRLATVAMIFAVLAAVLPARTVLAGDAGGLDPTFGTDGTVITSIGGILDYASGVAVQTDGKIVAAGQCTHPTTFRTEFCVARYNADGSLDTSFDTDGTVTTAIGGDVDQVSAVAIQADGKIVAVGDCYIADVGYSFCLARYNMDGSLDRSLTTHIGGNQTVTAMAIQDDGKIVVVGWCSIPGLNAFCLARYDTDLSLDTSFGGGPVPGDGFLGCLIPVPDGCDFAYPPGTMANFIEGSISLATGVAMQSDGKIVVAGYCYPPLAGPNLCLARYNTDGSLDGTVSTDSDGYFTSGVVVQDDGKIAVVGYCNIAGLDYSFCLARYDTDLSQDLAFGTDGVATAFSGLGFSDATAANAVALQGDGSIVVAGQCVVSFPDFCLARFMRNGSVDSSFGTDGKATAGFGDLGYQYAVANAVAVQSDGKIVAAGYCSTGPTPPSFCLARFDGGGTTGDNSAPIADAGGPYTVDEGSSVLLDGTGSSDPDGSIASYSWSPATNLDDASLAQPTYTGIDDAVETLTFTVIDNADATDEADATVTVANVAPSVSAGSDQTITLGDPVALDPATFTDPGTADSHTAEIDWGDGSVEPGTVTQGSGFGSVDGSHAYAAVGTYTVSVSVTDDDGETDADSLTVTVAAGVTTFEGLIDAVEGLDLSAGIERSLVKKIANAQQGFAEGDLDGARDKLQSLLSQIDDLEGKKLTTEEAAILRRLTELLLAALSVA